MVASICSGFIVFNIVFFALAAAPQPKILNGIESDLYQFPYYVFIETFDSNKAYACGGTVINHRWILTAAHCLRDGRGMKIYFGSIGSHFYHVERVGFDARYIHPNYDHDSAANDIALIRVPRQITTNQAIQPVKLSQNCGEQLDEDLAIAIGKGGDTLDDRVRYAVLNIRPKKWCRQLLLQTTDLKPNSVICAYSVLGQSIFTGDSGGPLIRRSDGALVGVSSFIQGLYSNQAFTNVHYYNDWISKVTGLTLPNCTHLNSASGLSTSSVMSFICISIVLVLRTQ